MIRLSVIGHLGQDALKKVINGKSVLSFSVAQNEQIKSLSGEVQHRTTWVNCSVWERDNLAPYLKKGTHVMIEGRPTFRTYSNPQGEAITGIEMKVSLLELLGAARVAPKVAPEAVSEVKKGRKRKQEAQEEMEEETDDDMNSEGANDLPF